MSPTFPHTALLADIATTRSAPEDSLHNAARFLFLPAFVAEATTFGFGVMQGHEIRGVQFEQDIPMLMPFRFLRDSRSRRLLFATDFSPADCVLVYSSEHVSATTSTAITARFSRSRLHAALQRHDGYVTVPTLLSALVYILEETHVRSCPMCEGGGRCGCGREVAVVRHPYDFEHFRKGMNEDFGEFEGISNKLTGEGSHTVQGVRVRMARTFDSGVMKSMGKWVVTQSLRERGSAWDSVLFGKYGEEGAEEEEKVEEEKDVLSELMEIRGGMYGSPVSGGDNGGNNGALGSEDRFELLGGPENGTGLQWWELGDESGEGEPSESGGTNVREDLEKAMRKKLMDERRKARNRESAKRSNAKNKKKKEEMQFELECLYEREEELREMEKRLRRENLSLKNRVRRLN